LSNCVLKRFIFDYLKLFFLHFEKDSTFITYYKVEKLIKHCNDTRFGNEKQPAKPLIRLKVDYTDYETINEIRFAQRFVDTVANPRNILQFTKYNNFSELLNYPSK
jgi:hypothetical protein